MYRNSYQRGMLTVFFSCGSKPLNIWETHCQDGYITRFLDQDIKSMVLEIGGTNVSTTFMSCPKGRTVLGITMPFLVMIVKNLKKYFSFEVTILDETGTRRRFRVSNFQSQTQILPLCTVMPIGLAEGWNQIQFNLAEFTRRAYKKQFVEVQKVKVNANIRLRRIYFTERLVPEDQLPPEYKLFFPLISKGRKKEERDKENIKPSSSQNAIEERKVSKDIVKAGSKVSVKRPSQEGKSKTKVVDVAEIQPVEEKLAEVVETPVQTEAEVVEADQAPEAPVEGEPVDEETPKAPSEPDTAPETQENEGAPAEAQEAVAEAPVEAPEAPEAPADAPAEPPAEVSE